MCGFKSVHHSSSSRGASNGGGAVTSLGSKTRQFGLCPALCHPKSSTSCQLSVQAPASASPSAQAARTEDVAAELGRVREAMPMCEHRSITGRLRHLCAGMCNMSDACRKHAHPR